MRIATHFFVIFLFAVSVFGVGSVKASENEPALTVNGKTLSKAELNERIDAQVEKLKNALSGKKNQIGNRIERMRDRIREQTITKSIRELVLKTKADEAGVTVSDERVDEAVEKQRSKVGDDEFEAMLNEQGMTISEFRDTIRQNLAIRSFLDSKTESVSVSDEEARQFYDKRKATIQAKSFEEIKEQVKAMLKQRKKQQAQLQVVKKLRKESDVTIHVDKTS